VQVPDIRYARSGDVNIAYRVVGEGPMDVVMIPGWISHLEAAWELPEYRTFFERIAAYGRVITFDKRGTGMSDRVAEGTDFDTRMDDLRAVMDAAGSRDATVAAWFEAVPMAILFAATYPDRVRSLVLGDGFARWTATEDYPWGPDALILNAIADSIAAGDWGRATTLELYAPDAAADDRFKTWWARFERLGASPGTAADFLRMNTQIDVRQVLATVQTPTLVLHRADNPIVLTDAVRYLADRIPGAVLVETPGRDILPYSGDATAILDCIIEFLTGTRPNESGDRVLATVLFTDIVDSTACAARLGDTRWRSLLDQHDALVTRMITDSRGRIVKHTGDGVLALFDGPTRAVRCARALNDAAHTLGSSSGVDCTPVKSSCAATILGESPCTSALASEVSPAPTRFL